VLRVRDCRFEDLQNRNCSCTRGVSEYRTRLVNSTFRGCDPPTRLGPCPRRRNGCTSCLRSNEDWLGIRAGRGRRPARLLQRRHRLSRRRETALLGALGALLGGPSSGPSASASASASHRFGFGIGDRQPGGRGLGIGLAFLAPVCALASASEASSSASLGRLRQPRRRRQQPRPRASAGLRCLGGRLGRLGVPHGTAASAISAASSAASTASSGVSGVSSSRGFSVIGPSPCPRPAWHAEVTRGSKFPELVGRTIVLRDEDGHCASCRRGLAMRVTDISGKIVGGPQTRCGPSSWCWPPRRS